MGHVLFVVLHVIAILFGWVALILTIPLHLIYAAVSKRRAPGVAVDAPSPTTHVRCPDCKELVLAEAVKCKHCGAALKPVDPQLLRDEARRVQRAQDDSAFKARMIVVGVVVVVAIVIAALRS
jgi:hypothetical protein